jgi:hypothetical protein
MSVLPIVSSLVCLAVAFTLKVWFTPSTAAEIELSGAVVELFLQEAKSSKVQIGSNKIIFIIILQGEMIFC